MRSDHPTVRSIFSILGLAMVAAGPLSGTKPWPMPANPAAEMVEQLHSFLDKETARSVETRSGEFKRSKASRQAYEQSIQPNRERLQTILGATGERVQPVTLRYGAGPGVPVPLVSTRSIRVTAVSWSVYPGFDAEGLLVEPNDEPRALVVAIPDADSSPESLAGLLAGVPDDAQVARRLAEAGCRVLVPTLIDRTTEFSGSPLVRFTNLSHREWIYRMSYETGRHPIGYEVDTVRAGVEWLIASAGRKRPVAVVGHGEGGRIALYTAAIDLRIDVAWIAGAFGPRERVWSEPIDRNVWSQLKGYGDAEVASMILPRTLIIEASRGPEVKGPPQPAPGGRSDAASGRLTTPRFVDVSKERDRLKAIASSIPEAPEVTLLGGPNADGFNAGGVGFLALAKGLELPPNAARDSEPLNDPRPPIHARRRMGRIVGGLVDYTQSLIRTSELRRTTYWSKADNASTTGWETSTKPYREAFSKGLIGELPPPTEPIDVRSKEVFDEPKWTGYAVEIPVYQGVVASGVLLLPKDLKPGERRPVVVCQHGLEGTPDPIVNPRLKSVYNSYGAQLADRGYIVYAPQNPYIGNDRFRLLQRKANPLGLSLFSIIVRQHEQTLTWLKSRPEVDPARIAFYGLSYGGKTAMRVPAILKDYCLSICSADFNEWVEKCTNTDRKYSYLYTIEYDMYEFGLAERFNYAEMANLIAPRPFMVERGHEDGVAPDEWVGYEYAKVRRTYDKLGIGDRTELGIFNAGHEINGKATFAFLAKHLDWPRGAVSP